MYSIIGRKGTNIPRIHLGAPQKPKRWEETLVSTNGFYFPKNLIQFDAKRKLLPNLIQTIPEMDFYAKSSPIYLRKECFYQSCRKFVHSCYQKSTDPNVRE